MDELTLDDLEDLTDTTCPYCGRAGNGEPCTPYCGASDEALVRRIAEQWRVLVTQAREAQRGER